MNQTPSGYTRGLHALGSGCWTWLEPPGSWGLANSGLVIAGNQALVVDTQNDMPLSGTFRAAVDDVRGDATVTTVVNTHADGDHWNGNLRFEGARILASEATVTAMRDMWLDPSRMDQMAGADTALGRFIQWRLDTFDFNDWRSVYPTEAFTGEMQLDIGGRGVELLQVGPAHTAGDTIVAVPDAGVIFAGDVLFTGSTPIMWAGPMGRCVEACERILAHDPRLVVPGHGPVVTADGVRSVMAYLQFVEAEATAAFHAGKTPLEAYEFDWTFTRDDLEDFLKRIAQRDPAAPTLLAAA
jgi:cyclase